MSAPPTACDSIIANLPPPVDAIESHSLKLPACSIFVLDSIPTDGYKSAVLPTGAALASGGAAAGGDRRQSRAGLAQPNRPDGCRPWPGSPGHGLSPAIALQWQTRGPGRGRGMLEGSFFPILPDREPSGVTRAMLILPAAAPEGVAPGSARSGNDPARLHPFRRGAAPPSSNTRSARISRSAATASDPRPNGIAAAPARARRRSCAGPAFRFNGDADGVLARAGFDGLHEMSLADGPARVGRRSSRFDVIPERRRTAAIQPARAHGRRRRPERAERVGRRWKCQAEPSIVISRAGTDGGCSVKTSSSPSSPLRFAVPALSLASWKSVDQPSPHSSRTPTEREA
jgi:hypothetical protein